MQGYGVCIWSTGKTYKGEWLNNKMHGKGMHTWQNGHKYDGICI